MINTGIGIQCGRMLIEYQYASALKNCSEKGIYSENRTGISTNAVQHQYFYIEEVMKHFPILKGKKMFPKMALKELMWMLQGRTDVKWLQDRGVNYWNQWANADGTIGKSYGYQYRNFNGKDQFVDLIKEISRNPTSRRLIMNLWNISDLDEMSLPPCMYDYHFECIPVQENMSEITYYHIDLHAKQRSSDSFIGVPYDMMFLGWFLLIVTEFANLFGFKNDFQFIARDIHYTNDNFHIYENHKAQVGQYLDNVNENLDNVIAKDARPLVTSFQEIRKLLPSKHQLNMTLTIDSILDYIDKNGYTDFKLEKHYTEQYEQIKAEIAV